MKTVYDPELKAHLTTDEQGKIREILHTQERFVSEKNNARQAALDYLYKMADKFQIPVAQLRSAHQPVSFLDPREQDIEYRFYEVKKFFSAATYS